MFTFFKKQSPARIIALGFATMILLGSLLLILPCSVREGVNLRYIDALYTSTSAVCVTGLIAVVCIGEHMDTSILTTLNLVSMSIPKVIAKATSVEHGVILEKQGADVVYPERDMAIRLANRLEAARVLDFVQLSEKINVSKVQIPQRLEGKSVVELDLRSRFGLNIIAIENSGTVTENISPTYKLRKNDILYLVGSKEGLFTFGEWTEK